MKNCVINYPSGQVYCTLSEGRREYFYEHGTLKTIEHYDSGRLHGEARLYWPNGQLKRLCTFAHGVREKDEMWTEEGTRV